MKKRNLKRIISLTAAVLMVCSVTAGAMADMNTVRVTIKSGQTLGGICQQNGINLYAKGNKELIMSLNGFTDPGQLDRIKAGTDILLPAPANAAGVQTAGGNQAAAGSGLVPIVSGDASKVLPGDKVAFYIVLYTIQSGDSLQDLLNRCGTELGSYQRQMIMAFNGMNDLNKLTVNKMMFLPLNRSDVGTLKCTVLEHTITYGENVYTICRNYGLDLNQADVSASVQCFNPGMTFASVREGDKLYIPVTGASQPAAYAPASVQAITSKGPVETPVAAGTIPALGILRGDPALLPGNVIYDGYAVVMESANGAVSLRLEKADVDVSVAFTSETTQGYLPYPGDYVKVIFTPTDFQLYSIQFVYNVFNR